MDFKVNGSAGRGRPRKSWLECLNDDMKKRRWHTIGLWWSAIHGNV